MTQPRTQGRSSLTEAARMKEFSTPVRALVCEAAVVLHLKKAVPEEDMADLVKMARRRAPSPGKLRDIRERYGMSERGFAAVLGEDVRVVRGWEAGRARPEGLLKVVFHLLDELSRD